jgi:hypothetical protein
MQGKFVFFLLIFCSYWGFTKAQSAIWTSIGVEKQVKKWSFGAETEYRTQSNTSEFQRFNVKVEASYKIVKPVNLGLGYEFIYFNDTEYDDYQPRQRYLAFLQAKQKFGDFTISLREQGQRTIKDESDRIKANGEYDTYKVNPEWYWRNKVKVAYNIPHFPVNPSVSIETYYQLNNPDGNKITGLRYMMAFDYKLTKHQNFELYGLLKKSINVSDPSTDRVLGISYLYSF